MASPDSWWLFYAACALQALGLASVCAARWSETSRIEPLCQGVFLASLATLAGVAIWGWGAGSPLWHTCGLTLSVMAVGATLDFGRGRAHEASPFGGGRL